MSKYVVEHLWKGREQPAGPQRPCPPAHACLFSAEKKLFLKKKKIRRIFFASAWNTPRWRFLFCYVCPLRGPDRLLCHGGGQSQSQHRRPRVERVKQVHGEHARAQAHTHARVCERERERAWMMFCRSVCVSACVCNSVCVCSTRTCVCVCL